MTPAFKRSSLRLEIMPIVSVCGLLFDRRVPGCRASAVVYPCDDAIPSHRGFIVRSVFQSPASWF